jgi:hypothetical protein
MLLYYALMLILITEFVPNLLSVIVESEKKRKDINIAVHKVADYNSSKKVK